jgi:hypothetical protein
MRDRETAAFAAGQRHEIELQERSKLGLQSENEIRIELDANIDAPPAYEEEYMGESSRWQDGRGRLTAEEQELLEPMDEVEVETDTRSLSNAERYGHGHSTRGWA